MMHLTSVLLPAPFSPSSARKLPGASVIDTSVRAFKRAEPLGDDCGPRSGRQRRH